MKEAKKMLSDYAKYIKSLDKPELVKLIIGTDDKPPLLTKDEPRYSRPRILWALIKAKENYPELIDFDKQENLIYEMMNKIEGMKWDKFYNYDYLRFDVKKPSLYWVIFILLSALIGAVYSSWIIISLLIKLI